MSMMNEVSTLLTAFGIQHTCEPSEDDHLDDEVTISDTLYIQCGPTYALLNEWVDGGSAVKHGTVRVAASMVVDDLRRRLRKS